jgi:glycosyltransferase involved in cell wall biosynthesis
VDYLESSILSVIRDVETVLIGVDLGPNTDPAPLKRLQALPECAGKVEIYQGAWLDEAECFNQLARVLRERQIPYSLLMDTEDVYSTESLAEILRFVTTHSEAGQLQIQTHNYWKSPAYRIDPMPQEPRVIVTRIIPNTRFDSARKTNELSLQSIPEHVGVCHNFTFANHFEAVRDHLFSLGLSASTINQWKQTVWDSWNHNRSLRNLHPLRAASFRTARRINSCLLPETLSNHPYLKYESVKEQLKPPSTCSVIFEVPPNLSRARSFVQNLIETVPSDCQLIGCLPNEEPEIDKFLRSKPGLDVVTCPGDKGAIALWAEGSRVSTGRSLIFLRDCLSVEGDWVEGFQAAIEETAHDAIFFPTVVVVDGLPEQASPGGEEDTPGLSFSSFCFEQRRGQHYRTQTRLDRAIVAEGILCCGCSAETWKQMLRRMEKPVSQAVSTGSFHGTECFIIEDTTVFLNRCREATVLEFSNVHTASPDPARLDRQDNWPAVSIVIPVFNNLKLTKACLESICANTPPGNYEVIVVDNASTDGTSEYLDGLHPQINHVRNRRNLFFAKGCNRGAWASQGEYLLFLNNDTVVKPGWFTGLLETINKDPRIGIVGNKQLFPSSNPTYADLVWHAGVVITEDKDPWHINYGFDSNHPFVNKERDYPVVTGCCFLIRRNLFEALQGFDSQFQNGFEDVDLCLRAGARGYRIVYTPRSEIIHHVSSSESRFDREISNFHKFKQKWAHRLIPGETAYHRETGLMPSPERRPAIRVGYISSFNQKEATADYARQLIAEYPAESFVVLSEFGIRDRIVETDLPCVLRAWDRNATWYYPLFRLATTLDLDLIHLNFAFGLFPAQILEVLREICRRGKRLVVTFHETSVMAPLLRQICELAAAVIVHTPASRLELILNGCDGSKIHVVPPGVPAFRAVSREVREKMGVSLLQRLIVTPGFIRREKGILDLIPILAELRNHLDVDYLVLGSVHPHECESLEYLEECKTTISKHQLEPHVFIFDEFLEDNELQDYLSCADAVVLPYRASQRSWSGMAAAALSSGRPLITSEASVFSELQDTVLRCSGRISMTQAIYSVLTSKTLEKQLILNARRFVETHTWKRTADAHWEIYRQILQRPKTSVQALEPTTTVDALALPQRSIDSDVASSPSPSLLWTGEFFGRGINGESSRAMVLCLSSQSIPLRIQDSSADALLASGKNLFQLGNLRHKQLKDPIVHVDQRPLPLCERSPEARWNAVRCLFSAERLPDELEKQLRVMDELWVSSNFHHEACLNSGVAESRLFLLPETLDLPLLQSDLSPLPIDGLRGFNFLSIFPWHPCSGWDLLVRAFLEEFKQSEEVTLILKADAPPGSTPADVLGQISQYIRSRLRQDASKVKTVLLLARDLTPRQTVQLFRSSQCFVLPNRAEDSGRSVMTAMAMGIPVIATACGGNRDLMKSIRSYPLEARLVTIPARLRSGPGALLGTRWVEPSVEQIRELMRRAYAQPHEIRLKADKARQEILEACDWQRISNLVNCHLNEIAEKLERPVVKMANSRRHICWEGPQLVNHSLALVNREIELALIAADEVDLTILPVGQDNFGWALEPKSGKLVSHYGRHFHKLIDVHVRHQWPPNWNAPQQGHWVVIQPWEYGSLPETWLQKINDGVDEIWVPSEYVRKVYVDSGVDPSIVQVIPNGVDAQFFRPGLHPYPIPSNKSFRFLFVGGTIHRKGIDVLLQAYQQTFTDTDDVVLVIKDTGTTGLYKGQGLGDKIRELQKDSRLPSIVYLDSDLSDAEVARLYNACHCLVHPYRGEGFGLPVMEAMACGLPVIVTAGGATDDFVDQKTGYLVPARKQNSGNRLIGNLRTVGDIWLLEPDVVALGKLLNHVFCHREEAKQIGALARQKVEEGWTWTEAAQKILQRVSVLSKSSIRRFQEAVDCVVLVELESGSDGPYLDSIATMIQSLKQNSYASLKILLWNREPDCKLDQLIDAGHEVQVVQQEDLRSLLGWIRHKFRARFLGVASEPLIFSKQWFAQICAIGRQIDSREMVIAPSINLPDAAHYIRYEAGESEFQKFARILWRQHRGDFQEMNRLPLGYSAISWDSLKLELNGSWQSCKDWLSTLREHGVKFYWAKDTYVGSLAELACVPQPV